MQIGFNSETYTGSEGDNMISVTVSISNGILAPNLNVIVTLFTINATATGIATRLLNYTIDTGGGERDWKRYYRLVSHFHELVYL